MKNIWNIVYCFLITGGIFSSYANSTFAFSSNPPDGLTGSPADSLKTCRNCHDTFALNSGQATFSISAPGNYTSGEILNITVSFNNSTTPMHGFELSALDANNNHVGTFSTVDGTTQTSNGNYIKQTFNGSNLSGNASWNVKWTAPAYGVVDPVTFYASGVEANGDFDSTGDHVYTKTAQTRLLSAATPTPTPTPIPTVSPTATPVATPTATPSVITATVDIQPGAIDPNSTGTFNAYIGLPSPYSVVNIVTNTVVCEDAYAISGTIDQYGRYVTTFNIQDLNLGSNLTRKMTFTVSGELKDGTRFEGSDTVRRKRSRR